MDVNCLQMPSSEESECIQMLTSKPLKLNHYCWEMWLRQHQSQIQQALRELRARDSSYVNVIPEDVDRMLSDYEWGRHILKIKALHWLINNARNLYKHLFSNFSAEFVKTSYRCSCIENYRFAGAISNNPRNYTCNEASNNVAEWQPTLNLNCVQGARLILVNYCWTLFIRYIIKKKPNEKQNCI